MEYSPSEARSSFHGPWWFNTLCNSRFSQQCPWIQVFWDMVPCRLLNSYQHCRPAWNCVITVLCVWKLERVCSQTQLCQLRCFNDYTRQLQLFTTLLTHLSVPTGKENVHLRSLSDLHATRPQLERSKRNTPLHSTSTSAPRNFKLDTSHQTLSCL